jgi:putative redox protein
MANHATLTLRTVSEGLVFDAVAGSGAAFVLDSAKEPKGVSPVEALLCSLGACSAMAVIGILRKQRQDVTAYEVVVRGERTTKHPRRFTRIEVLHRVHGRALKRAALDEAIRLSDTKYCSVHATLAPGVEIVSRSEIVPA